MDGLMWEMKAPKGDGKWVISNIIKKAERQSENLIIDLRRSKLSQDKSISLLMREFEHSKRLRRMKIITKSRSIIDLSKQKH